MLSNFQRLEVVFVKFREHRANFARIDEFLFKIHFNIICDRPLTYVDESGVVSFVDYLQFGKEYTIGNSLSPSLI